MSLAMESSFTFQSAVHSLHVLRCLDDQRQRDILCDVTVVAEKRSFRAHRSVLASCSDYFSARMSSHARHVLIVNLPDEITVEGFEPLLQFAYTSKLLFTKENILEIRNCAIALGFRNLDTACFDFLIPKFFDSNKSTAARFPWKACCKTRCRKSAKAGLNADAEDGDVDAASARALPSPGGPQPPCPATKLTEDAAGGSSPAGPETDAHMDYSLLCPKYRKFQMACGKERVCPEICGTPTAALSPAAMEEDGCPLTGLSCSAVADLSGESLARVEEDGAAVSGWAPGEPCMGEGSVAPGPGEMPGLGHADPVQPADTAALDHILPGPLAATQEADSTAGGGSGGQGVSDVSPSGPSISQGGEPSGEPRSSVEREVAEHLAQGFWSDVCPPRASPPLLGTVAGARPGDAPDWLQQLDLAGSAGDCPFLRDLGTDAQLPGCEGASRSEESPYDASSHNSAEDSDSFDTEGDSESGASERACEVQLPFSVDRIATLSRNEFQQMLKQQHLTREQLDFVHDVRRRSKNRIAAQRCRKRKLDCIHNLECEIEKLRSEKEQLMVERSRLSQTRHRTWQSFSGLYQRVCSEAALRPEQLQVLAKYSSPDCPLSALISPTSSLSTQPELLLQAQALAQACSSGLSVDACPCEPSTSFSAVLPAGEPQTGPQAPHFCPGPTPAPSCAGLTVASATEMSGPSAVTNICQDLTSRPDTEQ